MYFIWKEKKYFRKNYTNMKNKNNFNFKKNLLTGYSKKNITELKKKIFR